jgi:hypothetical protein
MEGKVSLLNTRNICKLDKLIKHGKKKISGTVNKKLPIALRVIIQITETLVNSVSKETLAENCIFSMKKETKIINLEQVFMHQESYDQL